MIDAPPKTDATPRALPLRRADLVISPHSNDGDYVIKDPVSGAYYHLGPQESLLLLKLDGSHTSDDIRRAYERKFEEPLASSDLDDFVGLAESMHLLAGSAAPAEISADRQKNRQSILYWRKSVFDPDRLFNAVEPKIRFIWTRGFLVVSLLAMAVALGVVWVNRFELVSRFSEVLSWKTFFIAWIALIIATTLHEFAHGLTCKHFGGEVHEVGFLLLFFIPAFYCNVSDAWLMREKSKRLWITLAGGYCDLCLWAIAVFVWRVTSQDTLVNYLAWVILTICGVRSFFNFNPLLKLDGYYLLSDIVNVPNLRQRSWDSLMSHVRWVLWGAERPAERSQLLLTFGAAVWVYSFFLLALMFVGLIWWLGDWWGPIGTFAATAAAIWVMRSQFEGVFDGEVIQMLRKRWTHLMWWGLALVTLAAVLGLVPMNEKASGQFELRSITRGEIRAPLAAFLREVKGDEGDRVDAGAVVAQFENPDLVSKIAQKRAEIAEAQAKLRSASFGARSPMSDASREVEIRRAEVDSVAASVDRFKEELRLLLDQQQKLTVKSSAAGVITTPRLSEKVGRFFVQGELVCVVEEFKELEAQIDIPEQEAAHVSAGQSVRLKARSLPFDELSAVVVRVAPSAIAPNAKEGKVVGTLPVYCKITNPPAALRPGMTGFARIDCGKRAMGTVLTAKALRYLRTEFWW